jgi:hypothetical protein
MTKEQFKKHWYLIEKWTSGEQIQVLRKGVWEDIDEPQWQLTPQYRIKPQLEYIPFDYSDAERLIGRAIKSKDGRVVTIISYIPTGDVITTGGGVTRTFEYLFNNYEFIDGTPCGKLSNF